MIFAGVDAGSRAIKIVLVEPEGLRVFASGVRDQGINSDGLACALYDELLQNRGLARTDVKRVVATGYSRNTISFADDVITEITCHAAGVRRVVPDARTIIEVGGQDSKVLKLNESGGVQDFAMNDRCAAGTGRFLEVVADRLGTKLGSLGQMAATSTNPAIISSMCIVFAETEIIGLMASGASPGDIAAGVQRSIATRVASMAGGSIRPEVVFTGGVAMVPRMAEAMSSAIGREVTVPEAPQMTGALGAAVLAAREGRNC